jgi:hypothetical protein
MKTFKRFIEEQEGGDGGIPTNNASGGDIAGIGVGPQGEPPGRSYLGAGGFMKTQQRRGKRYKKRKEQQQLYAMTGTMPTPSIVLTRAKPQ